MTTPPARLPAFHLEDQFGRERDHEAYTGVALIVVVGNRQGARGVALWTAALRDVIGEERDIEVLPVADLGGVPRALRRMVRRVLPRNQLHWCVIDWDGQLGAKVRGEHGPIVVAVYGVDGALKTWAAIPHDAVDRGILLTLVEGASFQA